MSAADYRHYAENQRKGDYRLYDLGPTLTDVKALAPDLERFFANLDPVITASKTGMPATRDILKGAQPLLDQLGPFLGQINPIFQFLARALIHAGSNPKRAIDGTGRLS